MSRFLGELLDLVVELTQQLRHSNDLRLPLGLIGGGFKELVASDVSLLLRVAV